MKRTMNIRKLSVSAAVIVVALFAGVAAVASASVDSAPAVVKEQTPDTDQTARAAAVAKADAKAAADTETTRVAEAARVAAETEAKRVAAEQAAAAESAQVTAEAAAAARAEADRVAAEQAAADAAAAEQAAQMEQEDQAWYDERGYVLPETARRAREAGIPEGGNVPGYLRCGSICGEEPTFGELQYQYWLQEHPEETRSVPDPERAEAADRAANPEYWAPRDGSGTVVLDDGDGELLSNAGGRYGE